MLCCYREEWDGCGRETQDRGHICIPIADSSCIAETQHYKAIISSVQLLSIVWLFATPWTAACQASLSITNSRSLLKLMSIESVMPSNHFTLCRPFLLLPSICPSIRVSSNESAFRIRWPKYWSFSFSISSSNEYSGLISFRMDCLDLPAVQGTLKGLLQHHSSKASILQCSKKKKKKRHAKGRTNNWHLLGVSFVTSSGGSVLYLYYRIWSPKGDLMKWISSFLVYRWIK